MRVFSFLAIRIFLICSVSFSDSIPLKRDGEGGLVYPDGKIAFINQSMCLVELVASTKGSQFRVFRDFFRSGGKGELFRLSTSIKDFERDSSYGFYIEVTEIPDHPVASSSILWLRDAMTMQAVRAALKKGPVFLRDSGQAHYAAAVTDGGSLVHGMTMFRLDGKYGVYPTTVLTENTDEFVVAHERQHFIDALEKKSGFQTKKFASALATMMEDMVLMKGGISRFGSVPGRLLEFVLEQRADVARIQAMKAELGVRKTILVRKKRTKTVVEEIPFPTYYQRTLERCRGVRLSYKHKNSYGQLAYEVLRKIYKIDPEKARKFRAFMAENTLPSDEIGFEELIPKLE